MKKYLKLIRINHWLKNILVFLPLFFSGNILDRYSLLHSIIAFFIFSMDASSVYIINDIFDIEYDKKHPIKKKRPLASGEITIKKAIYVIILLLLLMIIGIVYLYLETSSIFIIIIPLLYFVLNILYSIKLKNIAIIDLVILVIGFVLRVIYGGISTDVIVSKYLYLMIIFGSYYLSLGKRRGELIKNGENSRNVLIKYPQGFLEKNMYVACGLSIVAYTLWCVDASVVMRVGHDYLFWTIPLLMIILELYSLDIEKDSYGDPIDVIMNDKVLFTIGIIYAIVMIFLLYLL